MRNYTTSKDYKLLKELLDKGCEIICTHKKFGVMLAKKKDGHYYFPYDLGLFPASEYNFKEKCKSYDLEFIEPTII